MGLQKNAHFGDIFEVRGYDVWCIDTKEKVLTRVSTGDLANFFGTPGHNITNYARTKCRRSFNGKKYAIRFASDKT